jgi:hypothetical protein
MAPKARKQDEDLVAPKKYKKNEKDPVPTPWLMPNFEPLDRINKDDLGRPNLPPELNRKIPELLFDLLFSYEVINLLVKSTNAYRKANPPQKSKEGLK